MVGDGSGLSYSTNKDDIFGQVQNQANQPQQFSDSAFWMLFKKSSDESPGPVQLKAVFEKKLGGISYLRLGAEHWYAYNQQPFRQVNLDTTFKFTDHYTSVFAESDVYVTNELAAKIGVRYEYSAVIHKSDIAPRLSLAYKTGKDAQVSVAYGIFYQKPIIPDCFILRNLDLHEQHITSSIIKR